MKSINGSWGRVGRRARVKWPCPGTKQECRKYSQNKDIAEEAVTNFIRTTLLPTCRSWIYSWTVIQLIHLFSQHICIELSVHFQHLLIPLSSLSSSWFPVVKSFPKGLAYCSFLPRPGNKGTTWLCFLGGRTSGEKGSSVSWCFFQKSLSSTTISFR